MADINAQNTYAVQTKAEIDGHIDILRAKNAR